MQQVSMTVDVEVGRLHTAAWTAVASEQRATLTRSDPESVVYLVADVDLGPFGDNVCVTVPWTELAEFVHRVEDAGLDGFTDGLDGCPPRGRSTPYVDAYGAGQVEARGRNE